MSGGSRSEADQLFEDNRLHEALDACRASIERGDISDIDANNLFICIDATATSDAAALLRLSQRRFSSLAANVHLRAGRAAAAVKLATDGLATDDVNDDERFKLRHVRLRAAVLAGVSEHLVEDFRAVWTYFSTSADKDWSALALKLVMGADKSTLAPVLDDITAWLDDQDNLKAAECVRLQAKQLRLLDHLTPTKRGDGSDRY